MADVILHGYQEEVVQRALQGENIIVWLPTGAGKTRAAVYVAHKHLERTPGAKDPFGAHVKRMMQAIHAFMEPPEDVTLREFGTQEYESDVVALQKRGVKERDRRLQQCAVHLRQYNDALLIHDTLLMEDALTSLKDFYTETTIMDDIDRFLVKLFQDNQAGLLTVARDTRYANPKMEQLESVLLRHFSPNAESRGIIFSKTRRSTQALHRWALAKDTLRSAGIKPATVTGGAGMTQHDRNETIRNFRLGSVNLLIATSVAEEGLDITECNLVVRYGLLTNEIAQQQARSRARAQDSHYSLVAQRGGPEERREHLNTYLEGLTAAAVGTIYQMSPPEFRAKIAQLQQHARVAEMRTEEKEKEKEKGGGGGYSAAQVQLLCANCLTAVARGSDIQLLDKTHYVNVNPQFRSRYNEGLPVCLDKTFEDWEPGCIITCNNGNCNKRWGYELKYHKLALLPNLAIKHFALETPGGRTTVKKWKDVPFAVEHFTFSEYCRRHAAHLLD